MMDIATKLGLFFLPLTVVLACEHWVLRHRYGKESSFERLFVRRTRSARTDIALTFLLAAPLVIGQGLLLLTFPGLALLALTYIKSDLGWSGFLIGGFPGFLLYLLLFDFAYYVAHRLLHWVPGLWKIHRLHHSAEEMSIITGSRVSLAERAWNQIFSHGFMTLLIAVPDAWSFFSVILIRQVIELLQHSDLPWDYGLLGKIIIGPRFHRLHHSADPRDHNVHFGNIFTFWDRLFGTLSSRFRQDGPAIADLVTIGLPDEEGAVWQTAITDQTIPGLALDVLRKPRDKAAQYGGVETESLLAVEEQDRPISH